MHTAAKLFLIAVLSVAFVRGASAYEAPALPIPSVTTGVQLTLPAGMAGAPSTSSLETALLGGGTFDITFGDDDDDDDDDYGMGDDDDDDDEDDEDDEDYDDEDDDWDY